MGWSCSKNAKNVLEAWSAACIQSTGSQNMFVNKGKHYFFQISSTEHGDGSVTGTVFREVERREDGAGLCKPSGSFRINPDGEIVRAPKWLKEAAS